MARFGAEMVLARDVVGLETRGRCTPCSSRAPARSRRAPSSSPPGCPTAGSRPRASSELTGRGVYYGANASEARQCRGRRGLRRRRGELGRPGGAQPRPVRQAGGAASCAGRLLETPCRSTSSSGSRPPPNIEVRFRSEVVAAEGDGPPRAAHARRPRHRRARGGRGELAVRLHRRLAAHRLARRRRRARRARVRRHRAGPASPGTPALAAGPRAVRAGDQRARASSPPATCGSTR